MDFQVGTRIYSQCLPYLPECEPPLMVPILPLVHDNPSSPPIYGHISAFEQMANVSLYRPVEKGAPSRNLTLTYAPGL